jgi:hypothetical protein
MRTETQTIKIFKFDELSETAKEYALNKHNETTDFWFLSDDLKYYLEELLEENKIKELNKTKLFYSLNYCQGGGAQFNGSFKWKNYFIDIKHSGFYYHSNCVNISISTLYGNDAKSEVYEEFKDLFENICSKIEKQGYAIIEQEQTMENFKDLCDINEYEFLENGEMV